MIYSSADQLGIRVFSVQGGQDPARISTNGVPHEAPPRRLIHGPKPKNHKLLEVN